LRGSVEIALLVQLLGIGRLARRFFLAHPAQLGATGKRGADHTGDQKTQ